jgi:hypothetical protein
MKKTKLSSSEIHDLINRYNSDLKKIEFQASELNLTISQLESLLKNLTGLEKTASQKTKKRKSTPVTVVSKSKKKRGRPAKKVSVKKSAVTKNPAITSKKVKQKKSAVKSTRKATANATLKTTPKKVAKATLKITPKKVAKATPKKVAKVSAKKVAKATPKKAAEATPKNAVKDAPKEIKTIAKQKKVKKTESKKGYKLTFWDEYVIESIKQSGKVRITQEIVDFVTIKMKESGKGASDSEIQNKVIRSLQKLANRRSDLKKVPYEGKGLAYALPEWMGDNGKLNKEFKR